MPALEIAAELVGLLLKLVSASQARELLDEAAIKNVNDLADTAEKLKFGDS